MYQNKEKNILKKLALILSVECCYGSWEFYVGKIIYKSLNWQHIQRLKINILGANWQLFRLEIIAKFSYYYFFPQDIHSY